MKNILTAVFLTLSTLVLAETSFQNPYLKYLENQRAHIKKGTLYLRAITDSTTADYRNLYPGFGLGYRKTFGHSGVDASLNFSQNSKYIFWTAPKVSYLYYATPNAGSSVYGGIGFGWGGTHIRTVIETADVDSFSRSISITRSMGLVSHLTLGYEFLRTNILSTFFELSANQPNFLNSFGNQSTSPIIELSFGAGF